MLLKIMHLEDTNDSYNSIHAVTEDSITRLVDFIKNVKIFPKERYQILKELFEVK